MKTTLLSILVFTGIILAFIVKKPTIVNEAVPAEVAAEKSVAKTGKSEFDADTKIAPKAEVKAAEVAKVTETPVAVMSKENVQAEIESLQQYVVRENAITRLNENTVSAEERAALGKVFERLLSLRSQNLKLQMEAVKSALEAYKGQHDARVLAYVGGK